MSLRSIRIGDMRRLVAAISSAQGAAAVQQGIIEANEGGTSNAHLPLVVRAAEQYDEELDKVHTVLTEIVERMIRDAIDIHEESRHDR